MAAPRVHRSKEADRVVEATAPLRSRLESAPEFSATFDTNLMMQVLNFASRRPKRVLGPFRPRG